MKTLAKYLALAAIAVILGSCSFALGALNHKKARVVASAVWHPRSSTGARTLRTASTAATARTLSPYVAKSRVLPSRPAASVAGTSRSVAPSGSKDISAVNDVDSITYTITNLDPASGEPEIFDYLDPYYPYIDVFLTPGQTYRIKVDVALLPTSPALLAGQAVGISSYGDSAVVAVPADGSDVWVDMTIHGQGIVINNQISGTVITYVDPTTGSTTKPAASATVSASPQDKFFYTSDSLLYYFNYTTDSVVQWADIASALVTTTPGFGGLVALGGPGIQIYAISPDPAYAGWFYVVGKNIATGFWELYVMYYDPAVGPTADWSSYGPPLDITADVETGRGGAAVVTGVAADLYGDVNVTFYNTDASGNGPPVSGLIQYYFGSWYAQYIPDTTATWTSADSIFTDVMSSGSTIYVLASPNTSVGSVGNLTGTADVYIFDFYLTQLSANPSPVARSYNAAVSLGSGSALTLPNKFVGLIQDGTFFVSQTDFKLAAQPEVLSAVSLDLSSVTSVP